MYCRLMTTPLKTRILVADDHPIVLRGLRTVLNAQPDFEVVAEATDVPGRRNVNNRIALWFMRWARCPQTADYPNPYEPWIEIWENGGSFSVEHGRFEVFDHAEHRVSVGSEAGGLSPVWDGPGVVAISLLVLTGMAAAGERPADCCR